MLSAAVYHIQQRTDSPEHMNITRVAYLIFEKAKTKKEINKVVILAVYLTTLSVTRAVLRLWWKYCERVGKEVEGSDRGLV